MVQRYKTFRRILALTRPPFFGAKAEQDGKTSQGWIDRVKGCDPAAGRAKGRENGK